MKFTYIVVKSGEIASRTEYDTDSMDAACLEDQRAALARLKAGSEPIRIGGTPEDPVIVGLGEAPIEWMRESMPEEKFQELERFHTNWAASARDTHFYFNYQGRGPRYQLIPLGADENTDSVAPSVAGSRFHEYVYNGVPGPVSDEDKEKEKLHFKSLAREVWNARPALYTAGPWPGQWEEYAVYFAAAMFLDMDDK